MTKIETFAQQHRLKVTRDECNDQIIQGKRGHLYFDGFDLCLMILDGPVRERPALDAIGGKLWTGDISRVGQRRVQDIKITGIPLENVKLAIRLVGARPRKILFDAQKAVLAKHTFRSTSRDKSLTASALSLDEA
jgi:hypothetical protein